MPVVFGGSEALPIDLGACNVLDLCLESVKYFYVFVSLLDSFGTRIQDASRYSEWVSFPKQIAPSDFGIAYKASSYTPRQRVFSQNFASRQPMNM